MIILLFGKMVRPVKK